MKFLDPKAHQPPRPAPKRDEARLSDTAEIEPLRPVAYNDVALEVDEPEALVPLSPMQKLMGALA